MNSRRGDAVYFGAFAVALAAALWLARSDEDAGDAASVVDFSLPGIELDLPFELPFAQVRFRRPETPRLELSRDTEGVILEVRRSLLESSSRAGDDVEVSLEGIPTAPGAPQLAAAFD